jgi:CBS domain-containing protein
MRVRMVMSRQVISAGATETLLEVARRMRADGVSALPVTHGEEVIGIISERDLVEALIDRVDPGRTRVSAYMTSHPQYASPDDDSSDLALRMLHLGVRHLPVLEGARLVGMVSARDLLLGTSGPGGRSGLRSEPGGTGDLSA